MRIFGLCTVLKVNNLKTSIATSYRYLPCRTFQIDVRRKESAMPLPSSTLKNGPKDRSRHASTVLDFNKKLRQKDGSRHASPFLDFKSRWQKDGSCHAFPVLDFNTQDSVDADIPRNVEWLSFHNFFTIELRMNLPLTFGMDQCQM